MGIDISLYIILAVVIPLLLAPIAAIVPGAIAYFVALIGSIFSFGSIISLMLGMNAGTKISYKLGGFAPPVGIEYQANDLNLAIGFLVTFFSLILVIYSYASVKKEIEPHKRNVFYSLFLLFLAGIMGIILTNDFFNLYVFVEIASLAIYSLIASGRDRKALASSFQYLILGTIGATFILIGVGLLYIMTGTLNFTDLAAKIGHAAETKVVAAAIAFVVIGILIKTGIFPFHLWMVNSYTYSPSFVSSLMCGTSSKVMIYVLIKVLFTLFGVTFSLAYLPFDLFLIVIAILAIIYGAVAAIYNDDCDKIFAYSSISFLGYILLAIALGTKAGITAAIVLIFYHALAKVGLFMANGITFHHHGSASLTNIQGLRKTNPLLALMYLICAFSIIGIPGTAGFISKFYLVKSVISSEAYIPLVVVFLSFGAALFYCWRILEAAYIKKPLKLERFKLPKTMIISLMFISGLNIYLGVNSSIVINLAENIARNLVRS